jgi:carbamoyl-phosphate synthase large subunit
MKTILVSGASGIVGYGVLRSLGGCGKELKLVGTSIYDDSVAPAFCDIFEQAPVTSDPGYIDWLLETIRKHSVDLLIPGIEIDMYKWVDHLEEIQAVGAIALINKPELVELCKDKWGFYEDLSRAGLSCVIESSLTADFKSLKQQFGLPFLLKPRQGFGSKGIVYVDNEDTFSLHQEAIGKTLLAQPVMGEDNEEYTASAFCDGSGGFYACMTMKRKLSSEGFTEKAEVVNSEEFLGVIADLCGRYHPIGPTNFQFRKCDVGLKLLEINPRISSSTSIRTAFGYNESAMAVDCFLENNKPSQPDIKSGQAVRYTEEYIFYDDSIHI